MITRSYNVHFFLLVVYLFITLIASSLGDIRCFCNLAHCVQTGYMCKSVGPQAACYSEYLGPKLSLETSRHGCVERLPEELQDICTRTAVSSGHSSGSQRILPSRFPSLTCCQHDMCNYVGKLDVNINSNSDHQQQQNQQRGGLSSTNQSQRDSYSGGASSTSSSTQKSTQSSSWPELWWFKIVVIAVPIGGSVVLVLLIMLAVRLLRQDKKRERHLLELRKARERQLTKPDLLLTTMMMANCDNHDGSTGDDSDHRSTKTAPGQLDSGHGDKQQHHIQHVNFVRTTVPSQVSNNVPQTYKLLTWTRVVNGQHMV